MPNITGFEQDSDFSDDPDYVTGKFYYDDGTSTFGQLPADQAKQYQNMSSVPPPDVTDKATPLPGQKPLPIPSDMPDAAAPPQSAAPAPDAPPIGKSSAMPDNDPDVDAIIKYESGGDPSRKANNSPKHAGLIQWGPDEWAATAAAHGTPGVSHEDMQKMSYAEQRPYVDTWMRMHGITKDSPIGDKYLAVAAPGLLDKSDDYVAYKAGSDAVKANPGWDRNKDGQVTVGELKQVGEARGGGAPNVPGSPASPSNPESQLPASMAGMLPAEAEQHGQLLTPEQLRQRQQGVYDRTMQDTAVQQSAAQGRIQGRTEMQQAQMQQAQMQQQDAQAELARQQKIQTDAEQNIQREVMQPIQKVDPKRYLRNMSTGDRVLGAIGIILAGVGQALDKDKGPNIGIQLMQDAINKDIDSQKEDIANARAQSQNRVQFWSHKLGSAESGISAAKLEAKQAAANLLNAKAMTVENADIKAQMMQASQQLLDSGQQEAQQLEDSERNRLAIKYAPPKPTKMTPDLIYKTALDMKKANATQQQIDNFFKQNGMQPPAGEAPKPKFNRDQARVMAVTEDAVDKIKEVGKQSGYYYDEKSDSFMGGRDTHMILPDAQNARVRQAAHAAAPVVGLVMNGGLAPHEQHVEQIYNSYTSLNQNDSLAALNQTLKAVRNINRGVNMYPGGTETAEEAAPQ